MTPCRTMTLMSLVSAALVAGILMPASPASSGPGLPAVSTYVYTKNLHPLGNSSRPASDRPNSDVAFWRKRAYQGHFDGFRIIDISHSDHPVELVNVTD